MENVPDGEAARNEDRGSRKLWPPEGHQNHLLCLESIPKTAFCSVRVPYSRVGNWLKTWGGTSLPLMAPVK